MKPWSALELRVGGGLRFGLGSGGRRHNPGTHLQRWIGALLATLVQRLRGGTYRFNLVAGSMINIPDGPQGPPRQCKPGVIVLAQMSRAPILPLSFAVDRPWKLRSWDRLKVPRPFSRIAVAIGEPLPVPRSLFEEELEHQRMEVEKELNGLGEGAEALLVSEEMGGAAR